MGKELIPKVDLIQASIDHLIAISFPKSSSTLYPLAVNIAQGASLYDEIPLGSRLVHLVVFTRTREDAGRARSLIQYTSGWKGVQIFAGGKLIQNTWQVTQVLECFLEASACKDWTAHCHRVIDDPYVNNPDEQSLSFTITMSDKPHFKEAIPIDRYIFPCSFLNGRFKFQTDHPAKPEDQIQAKAVESGCDWCPYFDPSQYRKIGTRKIYKDLY